MKLKTSIFLGVLALTMATQLSSVYGMIEDGLETSQSLQPLCAVMAGSPTSIASKEFDGQETYARTYKSSEEGDNQRINITHTSRSVENHTEIIEKYKCDHSCPSCQARSFSEKLEEGSALNCMEYALRTYDSIVLKKIHQDFKLDSTNAAHWSNIIQKAFTCVPDEPQDGDLVVYYEKIHYLNSNCDIELMHHFGIFRKSEPNDSQGTVEAQWGLKNSWDGEPFVYKVPVFFTYIHYGTIAKFYRLNEELFK